MKNYVIRLCSFMLAGALLTGCGASSADTEAVEYAQSSTAAARAEPAEMYGYDTAADIAVEDAIEEETVAMAAESGAAGVSTKGLEQQANLQADDRKLVYNVDLSLQTIDFDQGVEKIPQMTQAIGGYIQNTYVEGADMFDKYYSRSANFTARIPTDKLDAFLSNLSTDFHVVYQQNSVDDISSDYYDVQARLNSLRIQSERLTAMLETATELEYLLQVEQQLASVQYEIDALTTSINRMDHQVDYSTVTIHLQEVSEYEDGQPVVQPITFGERIQEAFGDSWEGFVEFAQDAVIFLIVAFPFLLILAVIIIVIVLLRRRWKRKTHAAEVVSIVPPPSDDQTPPEK